MLGATSRRYLNEWEKGRREKARFSCTAEIFVREVLPVHHVVHARTEGTREPVGDGKNDNNKSAREAENNNRESAAGTRPKGKNVRPLRK